MAYSIDPRNTSCASSELSFITQELAAHTRESVLDWTILNVERGGAAEEEEAFDVADSGPYICGLMRTIAEDIVRTEKEITALQLDIDVVAERRSIGRMLVYSPQQMTAMISLQCCAMVSLPSRRATRQRSSRSGEHNLVDNRLWFRPS